ncbi:unnamed protein product [Effrenium voratum]|uniref:Uncharacterized protein n=1 Tax=Effrenium voratum TaxID=2562239 RepID=A0AA36HLB1_9DINO|nr:unnamed protein product [Effrenium voratum]CAJ1433981.1 unnamed protein product [Effrenium voratum]|mmetsp:Transcript_40849/g.97378  ORF Transcript_40849/g.97378 Transcript_40849/m.97378 type:complete len:269 (+) Transcript_40849:55-861(+)
MGSSSAESASEDDHESLSKHESSESFLKSPSKRKGKKTSKDSKKTGSKSSKNSSSRSEAASKELASLLVSFEINAPPEVEDEFFDIPEGANAARMEDLKVELSKPHSALRLRIKDRLERAIGSDAVQNYEVPDVPLPLPKSKYKKDFTIHQELSLREEPKNTGNAYFMQGFSSQTAPFMGVRPDLLPVISQGKVGIDKSMLPALYQPFRKDSEHPYGQVEPSKLLPQGALRQPPEAERIFHLVEQEMPPPRATVVPRTFSKGKLQRTA